MALLGTNPTKDPSFCRDWADPREYTTGDIGVGECAGEVVSAYTFAMTAVERLAFEAQLVLDAGNPQRAGAEAYAAMLKGAKALVQFQYDDITDDPEEIIEEFRERYYDSKLFFDPFARGKYAQYLFAAHKNTGTQFTSDSAHHLIEEAQLFIEAVHSCYNRMRMEAAESA